MPAHEAAGNDLLARSTATPRLDFSDRSLFALVHALNICSLNLTLDSIVIVDSRVFSARCEQIDKSTIGFPSCQISIKCSNYKLPCRQ